MNTRRVVAGTAAIGLIIGCGGGRRIEPGASPDRTYLSVTNANWADVTIFAVRGLTRARIGFVTALHTRTFLVPPYAMPDGTVRLMVDPVGSDKSYVTEAITLAPGQHVELTVMPSMTMSTFAVSATRRRGTERDPR